MREDKSVKRAEGGVQNIRGVRIPDSRTKLSVSREEGDGWELKVVEEKWG